MARAEKLRASPPLFPSRPKARMRGPESNKGHGFGPLEPLSLPPSSGTLGKPEPRSLPPSVRALGWDSRWARFCFPHWGWEAWMQQVLGSGIEGVWGGSEALAKAVTCGFSSNGRALLVPICLPWPLPQSRSSKARQRLVKDSWPHHLLPTHATLFPIFHVNHLPFPHAVPTT